MKKMFFLFVFCSINLIIAQTRFDTYVDNDSCKTILSAKGNNWILEIMQDTAADILGSGGCLRGTPESAKWVYWNREYHKIFETRYAVNKLRLGVGDIVQCSYGSEGRSYAVLADSLINQFNTNYLKEGSNLYFTNSRARSSISLTTIGSGNATYNNSTGVLNIPTPDLSRSFNSSPNRSLSTTGSNNTFTISTTRDAIVKYTINFSVALVSVSSNGVVTLDYSTDGGSNWITVDKVSQVFGVSILTTSSDNHLGGSIPANALVRIYRSSNTNVTITAPTTSQQEVLQ